MKESYGRYAAFAAVLLVVGIDLTAIFGGASNLSITLGIFESFLDIVLIVTVFATLSSELRTRRKSEEALAAANLMKTKFMNMAAHDLRNPIGVIAGYSEIILDDSQLSGANRELVTRILHRSKEMARLIDDILDAQVVAQTVAHEERGALELNAVVSEVITDFRPVASRKSQHIVFTYSDPVWVVGAKDRMRQVVANLVSNAVKYSPPDTSIHMTIEQHDKNVRLSVSDAGPGLAQNELEKVFDPFSKVKKKPTGGETSTGLGLSISKALIENYGGKIWAESPGPGKGTKFIVDMPVHAERQAPRPLHEPPIQINLRG